MTAANPATTPVAHSKTAALARVIDSIPKGYIHYTSGQCSAEKVVRLARKFHEQYGIGCSPAQRMTRKKKGIANAILVMYWPPEQEPSRVSHRGAGENAMHPSLRTLEHIDNEVLTETPNTIPERVPTNHWVEWLLLATKGAGPVHDQESLRLVTEKPRLVFLRYELVCQPDRGQLRWTFRRTKQEMEELYALLAPQLNRHWMSAVEQTLLRISRQPGFSGVRQQSFELLRFAVSRGYQGELPHLFFVQKTSHGEPLML